MSQTIKIINPEGYKFPEPKYGFGQILVDHQYDIGFVTGMQYTTDEWEYQLFFTELEVVGVQWIKESNLSLDIVEVESV